jgi:hypothetical protein
MPRHNTDVPEALGGLAGNVMSLEGPSHQAGLVVPGEGD